MFHLALITVEREADEAFPALSKMETLESRLVGLRQDTQGILTECPIEHLLLLKGGAGIPTAARSFAATAIQAIERAKQFARDSVAGPLASERRNSIRVDIPARSDFIKRGYNFQEAELAAQRAALTPKARAGDKGASLSLAAVKEQQRHLDSRREDALAVLEREPELVTPGEVTFVAHALVVPSTNEEDKARHDAEVESIAVGIATSYEESLRATVQDVSKPNLARAAGLEDWCGFDLLSRRPDTEKMAIEVKGRARTGAIELKENEWAKACTLGDKYWLYVAYDCATPHPRLVRIQNPFKKLLAKAQGGVVINAGEIYAAAEETR